MTKPTRILRRPEVLQRTGFGSTTLWRKIRAGSFPKPVQLSDRAVGWLEDEVEDALRALPRVGEVAA